MIIWFMATYKAAIVGTRQMMVRDSKGLAQDALDSYAELLTKSRYCFAPRGDTQSAAHLFNAIAAGCVPIIVSSSPREVLPFEWLPWEDFSVNMREEQFLECAHHPDTLQILQFLADETVYRRKYEKLMQYRGFFTITSQTSSTTGDTEFVVSPNFVRSVIHEMQQRVQSGVCLKSAIRRNLIQTDLHDQEGRAQDADALNKNWDVAPKYFRVPSTTPNNVPLGNSVNHTLCKMVVGSIRKVSLCGNLRVGPMNCGTYGKLPKL